MLQLVSFGEVYVECALVDLLTALLFSPVALSSEISFDIA
jgi:hypothetical protein